MFAGSVGLETSICAETARWHGLSSKSRGAKKAILGMSGFGAKSAFEATFRRRPKSGFAGLQSLSNLSKRV